eukprot:COSAG06_NODE_112_length_23474_cov_81.804458_34_plen_159_part_00
MTCGRIASVSPPKRSKPRTLEVSRSRASGPEVGLSRRGAAVVGSARSSQGRVCTPATSHTAQSHTNFPGTSQESSQPYRGGRLEIHRVSKSDSVRQPVLPVPSSLARSTWGPNAREGSWDSNDPRGAAVSVADGGLAAAALKDAPPCLSLQRYRNSRV